HSHRAPRALHPFPTRRSSDVAIEELLRHRLAGVMRDIDAHLAQGDDGIFGNVFTETGGDTGRLDLERSKRLGLGGQRVLQQSRRDRKSTRLNSSHVKISSSLF